jgi:homoserine O-acetyltransferase/O-succinyltransferase
VTDWLRTARAATYSVPGFKFADGRTLDLRLHYLTLGALAPDRSNAVLMLHGTTGDSKQFLQPSTADFLFPTGQPLDACKNFIIMPDAARAGRATSASTSRMSLLPSTF